MEQIIELARSSQHEDVKNRILALIQAWAHAFRNSPKYRAVPVSPVFKNDIIILQVASSSFSFM